MSQNYYVTIGLEIHAELKTTTKMFCRCKNNPDEIRPNVNICPVCMAHPGALPVANKEAVKQVIRVGSAVGGSIADFSEFDRKSYFYPDIPKGYQISQYKYPIVSGGKLAGFELTRIHLEEDTGNSKHDRGDFSLVDFNRSGVPLMELVTEPHTFESADLAGTAAARFAREYQLLLWYLGASEANMEKGEMRVEANISVTTDPKVFGTKVEVKNLNSVRSAERAIKYEASRMIELIETGEGSKITQETRGWDEAKQSTFSQRSKEEAQDYRYFPDPDLPKMKLHEIFDIEMLKKELPELPEAKRARYRADFGIKGEDIEVYINDTALGKWFEEIASILETPEKVKVASNYVTSDILGIQKNNQNAILPSTGYFTELINMVCDGRVSSRVAKDILVRIMVQNVSSSSSPSTSFSSSSSQSPMEIAESENLLQKNDTAVYDAWIENVIIENPEAVASYKSGKESALMSLVGAVMKRSKGAANPQLVQKILKELL